MSVATGHANERWIVLACADAQHHATVSTRSRVLHESRFVIPNLDGNPVLAVMDVASIEEVSDEQLDLMTEKVFGTLDMSHPGVSRFSDRLGDSLLAGDIQVLNFSYFAEEFDGTFKTAC